MNIQPHLYTLNVLLSERLFRIPEYQRSYSWTKKERADLFSDIEKIGTDTHFMATIVGLRRETKNILTTDFHVIDVVDGQQRLTTLVVLLKAIEKALDSSNAAEIVVAEELRSLLVKKDELAPVLLQTNHDSCQHCVTYLRKGTYASPADAKTVADRCLLDAIAECEVFVADWKNSRPLIQLVATLKNKLTFIFHELDNEAVVYTVFEVLNSRGLDVSWFDRLKSMLMGLAFSAQTGTSEEMIAELHRLWRDIYECIGLRQGLSTETLKFAATLRTDDEPSRQLSEEDSVVLLRTRSRQAPKKVIEITEWILSVAKAVDELWADRRRAGVLQIGQARLLATSILLRHDLSPENREKLLGLWERVTFRIYGMYSKDARTKVGDYVRLAWVVANSNPTMAEIEAGLREIGSEFPVAKAVAELRDTDCYSKWQPQLRYFLFRYEEYLAHQQGQKFNNEQWSKIWEVSAADSIEHIQPQSKGVQQPTTTGIFVHRLGNLMLLPPRLNSKLQDEEPTKKKGSYVMTGLLQAVDVAARIPTWDRAAVAKREDELLAWAEHQWAD